MIIKFIDKYVWHLAAACVIISMVAQGIFLSTLILVGGILVYGIVLGSLLNSLDKPPTDEE